MVVVGWHANRLTSGQLSIEGSWILLLNNKSRELVPIVNLVAPDYFLIMLL